MAPTPQRYRFGLFELFTESGELRKSGERLRIQEQPLQVLQALVERPNEVVSREELRLRLWPSDTFVDFDHSLNTAINKVREVLGDTASNPRFVETLPRRGYRFIAPVEVIADRAEAQTEPTQVARPAISEVEPLAPTSGAPELPQAPRQVPRMLFGLLQAMYLFFYAIALWRIEEISLRVANEIGAAGWPVVLVLVTGSIGVCVRLYTLSGTLFDYAHLGRKFQRLFPFVLVLDLIWALSPFLLMYAIGLGLAFASCAALVYSPFAQRILALMAYPTER